jgi:hypothetical protein
VGVKQSKKSSQKICSASPSTSSSIWMNYEQSEKNDQNNFFVKPPFEKKYFQKDIPQKYSTS